MKSFIHLIDHMRNLVIFFFLLLFVFSSSAQTKPGNRIAYQVHQDFDDDWAFKKDSNVNAEDPLFDDGSWRRVDLPHDWSIEDLSPNAVHGPFDPSSAGANATGFTVGGTGWYRKKFFLKPQGRNKKVFIFFDGVYMNSDVWLNGHHLGNHPYGYTPFHYELTDWLTKDGSENVIAVRVRNIGKNSRWYSGSGIYRHVSLVIKDPVHIRPWDIYLTTPMISGSSATVELKANLENGSMKPARVLLQTRIYAPNGTASGFQQVEVNLPVTNGIEQTQKISVSHPVLWSIEQPSLYKAVIRLIVDGRVVDEESSSFGIRTIEFNPSSGFLLNGKSVLLKGGCIHHDNGPLGSATIDRAEERKIRILKENGFNAIRTSHNPPSRQLLDACDRVGMLVIDEAFDMWERGKNENDYHLYFDEWWERDLGSMLLRDRNHPSVIIWSIGNEINERADSSGLAIAKKLAAFVRGVDPTRPVTEAICSFWDHPGRKWEATAPAFALLDVGGYNYQWPQYKIDHASYPQRIMVGTESVPKEALENWQHVEDLPYAIGDFVWTAFDYIGETAIGHTILDNKKDSFSFGWPWYASWCGDIDLTGFKKPQSYYRDVVWKRSPIQMAVHVPSRDTAKERTSYWGWPDEQQSWTWKGEEGKPMQVRVFSRADSVRLELNGKVISTKAVPDSSITVVFTVPYEPGTLTATAIKNGKHSGTVKLETAGVAKRIRLSADRATIRADRNDLCYITVELVDEKGRTVPGSDIPVSFSSSGAAKLVATGSGDPVDMSSFQQGHRKTFRGRCIAILRPGNKKGSVIFKATSKGLTDATLHINVN